MIQIVANLLRIASVFRRSIQWAEKNLYRRFRLPLTMRSSGAHHDQSVVHASLILTFAMISGAIVFLSWQRSEFHDLLPTAITLPIVWFVSLLVRVAAQQYAAGRFSHDMETVLGPSGNLSTDYELLPPSRIVAYTVTGQLASLSLFLLGMGVSASLISPADAELTFAKLFDFHSGFTSHAWASQIMWLNLLIFGIHLMPAIPFDMRALLFAFFSHRYDNNQDTRTFKKLGILDSHLSTFLFAVSLSFITMGVLVGLEMPAWYAILAASIYFFVAGRWESARANELHHSYLPSSLPVVRNDGPLAGVVSKPHFDFAIDFASEFRQSQMGDVESKHSSNTVVVAEENHLADDLDEILRKIHREGKESLSSDEHNALIAASEKIRKNRSPRAR